MVDFTVPPGVDKALVHIIADHVGRDNAISRRDLLHQLHVRGFQINDRIMRDAISELRCEGHLIISTSANNGGYYMDSCPEDFLEFEKHEQTNRAMKILIQRRAMRRTFRQKYGQAVQPNLM